MKGHITGINDDYDGKKKHVRVEVEHGKRKRSKGPDGEEGALVSHDQKRSTVTVPRKDAANLKHGQKVHVRLEPDDTPAPTAPVPKKAEKARGRIRKVMGR